MKSNTVILGVTPETETILAEEFPELKRLYIEPYRIRYSRTIPLFLKLLYDSPGIAAVIRKEHEQLKCIVKEHSIDLVISDNRFGLYHNDVESIYITHQLNIRAGIWSTLANRIHRHYMQKFKAIWVPDFEERRQALAGSLSEKRKSGHVNYIGPLSRLDNCVQKNGSIDYLILLSGAEPQRSMLEEQILSSLRESRKKIVLVRGAQTPHAVPIPAHITSIDIANSDELSQLLRNAEVVICRSGYSTLMDLHHFEKKQMILIPTPGQTEQEYLARYWHERFGAFVIEQARVSTWKP